MLLLYLFGGLIFGILAFVWFMNTRTQEQLNKMEEDFENFINNFWN